MGRSAIVGDVLVDYEKNEWYFNGSVWDNYGQFIIGMASNLSDGLMSKEDYAKLLAFGEAVDYYKKVDVYNKTEVYAKGETYDKNYVNTLATDKGLKQTNLTLTPLTNGQTITNAILLGYDEVVIQVRKTTAPYNVDTDVIIPEFAIVNGNVIILKEDEDITLAVGATLTTVMGGGWAVTMIGKKYATLEAVDIAYDETYNVKQVLDTKIPKTDIVDNLTTNDATKVLSANQGKALQDTKEALANKATDFSVVNDTKYPTTKAVSERTFDKELLTFTLPNRVSNFDL